jgi:hypothetical protein
MTSAHILSTRCLSVSGWLLFSWLSMSACQPVPLQKPGGFAGASASGKTSDKKAGSGTKGSMAGASADAANAGAPGAARNGAGAAGTGTRSNGTASAAAGSAAGPSSAGGAGNGATANNPNALPVCEGKVDEYACDDTKLYHCVDGAAQGQPELCMTAAQCGVGVSTGQCGECDPGSFACADVQLQRCDDTGAWIVEAECGSPKLCKADMGICDTQVCHEGEYQCSGDQLQICNADFSDFMDEGPACEPGLCSKDAQGCLECLPDSPATCSDERTLLTCSTDGKLTPQPCSGETSFCAEGACVQCNADSDCGPAMSDCGTRACNAGVCGAGEPKPRGTACTSNGGKMCDYLGSCVTCVTDLDCQDAQKRCFLGTRCVPKDAIVATPLVSTWSVTVSPGFKATVTASMSGIMGAGNGELNSSQAIELTHFLSYADYSACGFTQIASSGGSTIRLGFSRNPAMGEQQPAFPDCTAASVQLTAVEL